MADLGALEKRAMAREQGLQHTLIAVQKKPHLGMAATGNRGPGENRRRTGVTAHRVK
jgi:hypothetical protein